MKKSDDTAQLGHIYDAINRIETYVNGIDKAVFLTNDMMQTEIIWDTVKSDLPALKPLITELLGK